MLSREHSVGPDEMIEIANALRMEAEEMFRVLIRGVQEDRALSQLWARVSRPLKSK